MLLPTEPVTPINFSEVRTAQDKEISLVIWTPELRASAQPPVSQLPEAPRLFEKLPSRRKWMAPWHSGSCLTPLGSEAPAQELPSPLSAWADSGWKSHWLPRELELEEHPYSVSVLKSLAPNSSIVGSKV